MQQEPTTVGEEPMLYRQRKLMIYLTSLSGLQQMQPQCR